MKFDVKYKWVTGQNVAGQMVADKSLRTKCRMDKWSQDNSLQDKTSRTYRRGQNVADKTSQKIRRMDKTSYGQMVAWTKCCNNRLSKQKNDETYILIKKEILISR